ncbi:MAG: allantoinase AllB [Actinobacteria bacterium]|nr:allantoinase AllB [Actinomycetota bacterium]
MRIRSTRVVTGGVVRPATITVSDGVITEIGDGTADLDYGELVIMPGLVDTHVHVNEPGRTDWEGFATATVAALAGGCTTIVDMPLNSIPPTVTVASLERKREVAAPQIGCDVGFWGGFIGPTDQLVSMIEAGVCGFKAFLVDSGVDEFPLVTPDQLAAAMGVTAPRGIPVLVHAEDPAAVAQVSGNTADYRSYLESRPVHSEVSAVRMVAELTEATGARSHVLHVSSGEAAEAIGKGPSSLSGETCPHYLTLAAEEVPEGATEFKCAPPIRASREGESLWEALGLGWLSMVVSDHSPAPPELKTTGDFATAWGGISSLQLRLPITWTGARSRGFGVLELTEWLATAPARLAGLDDRKGSIAVGMDADLVVWDPDGVMEVRTDDLRHRHPLTPYEGRHLRGEVVATLLRGIVVHGEGAVTGRHGRMLSRR